MSPISCISLYCEQQQCVASSVDGHYGLPWSLLLLQGQLAACLHLLQRSRVLTQHDLLPPSVRRSDGLVSVVVNTRELSASLRVKSRGAEWVTLDHLWMCLPDVTGDATIIAYAASWGCLISAFLSLDVNY